MKNELYKATKRKKKDQKEHDRRKKFGQKFKSFNLENFGPMAIRVEIVSQHILLHFGCQKTFKKRP